MGTHLDDRMSADDVLLLAKALHGMADACERSAKSMEERNVKEISVTNRTTGLRGIRYIRSWVEGISGSLAMIDASSPINTLLASEKMLQVAEKTPKFTKKKRSNGKDT